MKRNRVYKHLTFNKRFDTNYSKCIKDNNEPAKGKITGICNMTLIKWHKYHQVTSHDSNKPSAVFSNRHLAP